MIRASLFAASLLAAALGPITAMAQQQPSQPPCSAEENSQLDFWVGTWDAQWTDANGDVQHGRNVITRELGNCMIEENFDGAPGNTLIGHSISMYVGRLGHWKQIWMDNSGGFIDLYGGPDEEGFHFTMERPVEAAPHLRMIFRDITEDSFEWHWQNSQDGGETWADQWHISYSRAE